MEGLSPWNFHPEIKVTPLVHDRQAVIRLDLQRWYGNSWRAATESEGKGAIERTLATTPERLRYAEHFEEK